ncbi:MAG: hypothetical protein B6I36_10120 [Desulfobacteraceae bacterium 4572_35.1]|nr:MAG: hypothetical protein B6I36_10120 [Desulfobacteraceae bacterium 4572_35.1]
MAEISTQVSSSINGLTREFGVITHNLANVSTVGYKRRYNTFSKALMAQGVGATQETSDQAQLQTTFDFSQGSFTETGRSLDFALCGKGFFVIETPQGPLYTRNGMFQLDQNGQIVDSSGRIVAGQAGPISLSPDMSPSQISVSSDGNISVAGTAVGQFKLVDFKDKADQLVAAGLNCFQAPENVKPDTSGNLIVKQGFQEGSNVQMVEELTDMIMVTRLYEANMKSLAVSKVNSKSLMSVAMG